MKCILLVLALGCAAASAQALTPDSVAAALNFPPASTPLCDILGKTYTGVGSYRVDMPLFLVKTFGFRTVTASALIPGGIGTFKDYAQQVFTDLGNNFTLFEISTTDKPPKRATIQFYLDGQSRYSTDVCIRVLNSQ